MATRRGGRKIRSALKLGEEQAEADSLLKDAFYETDDYLTISSKSDNHCFLIARTGSGKSAVLQRLEDTHPDHVVRISPEDLSLPYVTNLGVMRYLDQLDVHLDPLFIALWKHVLLVELIRHRYKVNDSDAKATFLAGLRDRIKRDPGKRAALDYLDEFGGRFWVEADERVREITERFENKIDEEAKAKLGLTKIGEISLGETVGDSYSKELKSELADRFQRVVNETQLARLNKMMRVLDEDILDSPQNFTYVVIDDLDRDWVDERLSNALIRCLFRSVLDLVRVRNLKIIVALRTNIFEHLDFGTRSGGQEEKFRSLALRMRWTPAELRDMVDERIQVVAAQQGREAHSVNEVLPNINNRRGDPMDYILDRTLMRPRDLLAYLNEIFLVSAGKEIASWDDIHRAEAEYSAKRLLALRDEWKVSFPDIDKVFRVFRGTTAPATPDEFSGYLDAAALLLANADFQGSTWLEGLTSAMWQPSSSEASWLDWYQPLTSLLFDVGFIGLLTGRRGHTIYAYDSPGYASRGSNVESATGFVVHPAFQLALDMKLDYSGIETRS